MRNLLSYYETKIWQYRQDIEDNFRQFAHYRGKLSGNDLLEFDRLLAVIAECFEDMEILLRNIVSAEFWSCERCKKSISKGSGLQTLRTFIRLCNACQALVISAYKREKGHVLGKETPE